jgi:hypothetical protein
MFSVLIRYSLNFVFCRGGAMQRSGNQILRHHTTSRHLCFIQRT